MQKFQLIDEHLVEKIYDHLKSFDKLDKLSITVEEVELAVIKLTIKISDDLTNSMTLPHRGGVLGIPKSIEETIEYLSQQVIFFEDVDRLLGSELFIKSYRFGTSEYALGETVLDGVKCEFSFSYDSSKQCHIEIKFDRMIDGLRHESKISTDNWIDYADLEQTWSKFTKIISQSKEN